MTNEKDCRADCEEFFERRALAYGIEEEKVREMWNKYLEREVLDYLVEEGKFRVVGMNAKGQKVYASNKVANSPHHAPKKSQ